MKKNNYLLAFRHLIFSNSKLIIASIFLVVVMFVLIYQKLPNKYIASSELVIVNEGKYRPRDVNPLAYDNQFMETYRDIIYSEEVLDKISDNMGRKYSKSYINDNITFYVSNNSQILQLQAIAKEKEDAKIILDNLITVFTRSLGNVYQDAQPSVYVLSSAETKEKPLPPYFYHFIIYSILFGLFISSILIIIKTTIDDSDDYDELFEEYQVSQIGELSRVR